MAQAPKWKDSPTLEECIRKCLVQHPVNPAAQSTLATARALANRQTRGLAQPPALSGLTAENLTQCSELYTHEELVAIAQRHGVPIPKSHMGLCMRLLSKGLLNPNAR